MSTLPSRSQMRVAAGMFLNDVELCQKFQITPEDLELYRSDILQARQESNAAVRFGRSRATGKTPLKGDK